MTTSLRGRASAALIAALAASTIISHAAAAHEVDADAPNAQIHALSGFSKISVSGVYVLDVQVGEGFFVQTSGKDKEVENMVISVEGDTLILGNKGGEKVRNWRGSRKGVRANITLPKLLAVEVEGIATGHIDGIAAKNFSIETAGITDLELSGRCTDLTLEMSGMGDVDARSLKCEDVSVSLDGMGSASVYASERVDASASGMGSVDVFGKPNIVQKDDNFMARVDIK